MRINYLATFVGIALWALVPGFIAQKKGRSFAGYYFLSFLVSPLISMIITFCLRDLNNDTEYNNHIEKASIKKYDNNYQNTERISTTIDRRDNPVSGNTPLVPVHTIPTDYGKKCPICGLDQKSNRTVCWNCSTPFISESGKSLCSDKTASVDDQDSTKTSNSGGNQSNIGELESFSSKPQDIHETIEGILPRVFFCRKCGHPLNEDSEFCGKCGTKVIK